VKAAMIQTLRLWQAGDMQRANHIATTAHRLNKPHAGLYFLAVFISIEAGHFNQAQEMLERAKMHKSFLRTNAPARYAEFCYLYALLSIRQEKIRAAKKYWRELKKADSSVRGMMMQGLLHLAEGDLSEAYAYLLDALDNGCNSVFLYDGLHRCGHFAEKSENSAPKFLMNAKKILAGFEIFLPKNSRIRHIYIAHPEKRGASVYDVRPTDRSIMIEAGGENFTCACFSAGHRTILNESLHVNPLAADIELYKRSFANGDRNFFVVATLANYYLKNLGEAAIPVFEAMLEQKNISKAYKVRILEALGQFYYTAGNFEKTLVYSCTADENAFSANAASYILNAYMETGETVLAAEFLAKKSYGQLTAIAKVLKNSNNELDRRIIKIAVSIEKWDADAQKAFVRLHLQGQEVTAFVDYATKELLANSKSAEYDTVIALEDIFLKNNNNLLCWALGACYLTHNITTPRSQQILKAAVEKLETEEIIFPVFKQLRGFAFLEKNYPFLHKNVENKKIILNFKQKNAEIFTKITMKYVGYGLYSASLPLFYNDELICFFSEEKSAGSIATEENTVKNTTPFLFDHSADPFFDINNALIYEKMFDCAGIERSLQNLHKKAQTVRSKLL